MKLVVFGLTISSSWGNGHATLWRGLCRALRARGHEVVFFERDVPYYRAARDPGPFDCELVLYDDWASTVPLVERTLGASDAAIVTSYCPDAQAASERVLASRVPTRAFYDLDSPVTIFRLQKGEIVDYLPSFGLGDFDLVLSFAGGRALDELRSRLGARRTVPLFGSVDASLYRPVSVDDRFRADLSYLGTYAADRHPAFRALFLEPASRMPTRRFLLGGSLYPEGEAWPPNLQWHRHVHPSDHPAFHSSSRLALNLTRKPMKDLGHCPSGRLFEAAACGVPMLSDNWEGLSHFFEPGREILLVDGAHEVESALERDDAELKRIGRAARERVWAEHRAEARAEQLIQYLSNPARCSYSGGTETSGAGRGG